MIKKFLTLLLQRGAKAWTLTLRAACLVVTLCICATSIATAQTATSPTPVAPPSPTPDPHAKHQTNQTNAEETPAHKYFSDVQLINQDGQTVRFYSDMLKGKTVIINAFYATCNSVCPVMNRNLEKVQDALGDRVGRDVFIVSITVDPATDTPARLKEYAQKLHAKPGWSFLTGKKENVDWALYKVGQYVEKREDHTTVIIIGNEATGLWKKAFGLAKADELVKVVEDVLNDKGEPASK